MVSFSEGKMALKISIDFSDSIGLDILTEID